MRVLLGVDARAQPGDVGSLLGHAPRGLDDRGGPGSPHHVRHRVPRDVPGPQVGVPVSTGVEGVA